MKNIILFVFFLYSLLFSNENILLDINTKFHTSLLNDIIISDKLGYIITASEDKTIGIFSKSNGNLIKKIYGFEEKGYIGSITSISLNESNDHLAISGLFSYTAEHSNGHIRIYDLKNNKYIKVLKLNHESKSFIMDLFYSQNKLYALSAEGFYEIDSFDYSKQEFTKINTVSLLRHFDKITTDKGRKIVIHNDNNELFLFNLDKHELEKKISINSYASISQLKVENEKILVTTLDGKIFIYDENLELEYEKNVLNSVSAIAMVGNIVYYCDDSKNQHNSREYKENEIEKLDNKLYGCYSYNITNDEIKLLFESKSANILVHDNDSYYIYSQNFDKPFIKFNEEFKELFSIKDSIKKLFTVKIDDKNNVYFGSNFRLFEPKHYSDYLNKASIDFKLNVVNNTIVKSNYKEYKNFRTDISLEPAINHNTGIPSGILNIFENNKQTGQIVRTLADGIEHRTMLVYKDYILTAGGQNGTFELYDKYGQKLIDLTGHNSSIEGMDYNENYIISADQSGMINIWDISKIEKIVKSDYEKIINPYYINYFKRYGFSEQKLKDSAFFIMANYGIDIYMNEAKTLTPAMSIFIDTNNEFVIWTEEGYFTVSSPKALKNITWHMNQGYDKESIRYDIGKFYDVFFRPDLVKLKFQGKDITPYTKGLTAKDALKNPPPEVKITTVDYEDIIHKNDYTYTAAVDTKKDFAKIKFNVSDFGGGVGTIRVYQEGKLIKTIGNTKINKVIANIDSKLEEKKQEEQYKEAQHLALAKAVDGKNLKLAEQVLNVMQDDLTSNKSGEYEIDISLKKGINQISIEAFNKTNTITSFRSIVNIKADIPKRKTNLYAIVVGVNDFESTYSNELQNLKYSVNDAKSISDMLLETKDKIFDKVEVIKLTDNNVTKVNIEQAFKKIKEKASLEDTIVFYISTHGMIVNGKFYLIPSNNSQVSNLIEFNEVFKESSDIKSLNQIFIIDSCQSGNANDIASAVYDSRASVLARSSGIHLLSASTSGTYAFENNEYEHSNFTYHILDSMKNKETDKNKDGFISVIELSDKLRNLDLNEKQFPVIQNIGNDINLNKAY